MATGNLQDQEEDSFDPKIYLSQYYTTPGTPQNYYRDIRLKFVHEHFQKIQVENGNFEGEGIKVLDYGCGPVVSFVISAAGVERVSQIVLAEFTERNREAITDWIHRDKTAFDWRPYFKHVVTNLENKSESHLELREERLRSLATVVSYDIKAKDPIEKGYEGPYDVVTSFVAIECACQNEADYLKSIEKLAKLVKSGGSLLMFTKLARASTSIKYNVGSSKIHYFCPSFSCMENVLGSYFNSVEYKRVSISDALVGLSEAEIAKLEAHPCPNEEFYYMLTTTHKK